MKKLVILVMGVLLLSSTASALLLEDGGESGSFMNTWNTSHFNPVVDNITYKVGTASMKLTADPDGSSYVYSSSPLWDVSAYDDGAIEFWFKPNPHMTNFTFYLFEFDGSTWGNNCWWDVLDSAFPETGGLIDDAWYYLSLNIERVAAGMISREVGSTLDGAAIDLSDISASGDDAGRRVDPASVVMQFDYLDDASGWDFEYFLDDVKIVPEPATLALLGLGGLALCRRRR